MRKLKTIVGGALIGSALLTGAAAPTFSAEDGKIVIVQPVLRQQFDPTGVIATTDFLVHDNLFDGLINLTEEGLKPALALSWKVSADGLQIDFKLREGVKFHNGDPFTAEDVKFSFERVISPDSIHAYRKPFQKAMESVEVLGSHDVRFHLKAPWPGFFTGARNALVGIVPAAYYQKVGTEGFQKAPIGTGPFKLSEIKAGEWTEFTANEDYWNGAPEIKAVRKILVKEPFTRYAMLTKGEADILMDITGPLLEKIRENKEIRMVSAKYSGTSGFYFNKTSFPESQDKNVRMAFAHAINLKDIADNVLGGVCEPAASIATPATFGFLPGLKPIEYDPAKAKQLLKEAGIEPGKEITFLLHTESFGSLPNAPQTLESIAGYLEAVGFKVTRVPVDSGAYLQMYRGGKQPDVFYGPSSIPDDASLTMDGWFLPGSVWSSGNINEPAYVDIYNRQLVETDLDKRIAIIQEFLKLEDEKRTGLPLFWCSTPFAIGPRVKDWTLGLGSGYHMNLDTVKLTN
ncbi:ABC transporter substrate-binding protein [Oceanibacterium hippocampi]|uniref:Heme-binding protein A n=1 Tax=Oceanibacterium hippocampi TaxID=745714 RepID=A0A1Y5TZN7_9PROT|nr:ABC transporter substrate-binding protein [Oceanibacterium hippocampi]SLN72701.1 Heme-binding protein A precursor [Oceanibacterium hippocampi]